MKAWKRLSSATLLRHSRLTVVEDNVELPDGNQTKYIKFSKLQDGAVVVCIKNGMILIQTEYSYPPNLFMYQLPGGGIEEGEDALAAGCRELQEESGYIGTPSYLGYYYPDNRRSDAKTHFLLIEDPTPVEKVGGDIEECIKSEWINIGELRQMIAAGKIVNSSILVGLSFYDNR